MIGVLEGFAIIGVVIAIGYLIGRLSLLGEGAHRALGRLVFFVLSPCLLFTVLAKADVHVLFSSRLVVSALAAMTCFVVFAIVARLVFRQAVAETVIGSLGSGYVNANNIGIPVAAYVLGDASYSAPVVLVQLLVFAPIALSILDATTRGRVSFSSVLLGIVRNPLIIASALGTAVALSGLSLPALVFEPFALVGAAAVPVVLIAFGMSLSSSRLLEAGSARRDVILASSLKLALMPLVAWALGHFVFGMVGHELFAIVTLATLPSAQNVFNYAQRYERGEIIARDTVLITTVLCVPVLLVVAWLLAPSMSLSLY
jgi:malonate transporter and related proteins